MSETKVLETFIKSSIKSQFLDSNHLVNLLDNLSDQQISNWGRSFDASESYGEAERADISHWKTKEKQNNFVYVNLKNAYSPKMKDELGKYIFDRQDYQTWLFNRIKGVIDKEVAKKQNETTTDKIYRFGWYCAFIGLGAIFIAAVFDLNWLAIIGIVLFTASFLNFTIIRFLTKSPR